MVVHYDSFTNNKSEISDSDEHIPCTSRGRIIKKQERLNYTSTVVT